MTHFASVVDASVAVKLYLNEPFAAQAKALFALLGDPATQLHVPDLFYAECANILWKQVQRQTLAAAQVMAHAADVAVLPLQCTPTYNLFDDALAVAVTHGISAYDACYVVLAGRLGVPLITADWKLVQKLAGSPHAIVWLGSWTPPAPSAAVP